MRSMVWGCSRGHCPAGKPDVQSPGRIGKFVDDNGDTVTDRSETFIYNGAALLSPLPRFGGEGQGEGVAAIRIRGVNGGLGQYGWVDDVVLVYSDSDGSGPASSTLTSRNLYGPLVDQIFASEDATGNVLWALTDQLGTARDWADRNSSTGTTSVALHTRFTAFGAIESVTDGSGAPLSSSILPPSSFTGQLYDVDVELYYYRARRYDPLLGKFLSDDPMSFGAGDANVSRYVRNGVSVATDPTGLDGMDIKMDIWIRARNREHRHNPPPKHPLTKYRIAANAKGLPTNLIDEIIAHDPTGTVSVTGGGGPRYFPFWNEIQLPDASFRRPLNRWTSIDWANMYNEMFHAWWDVYGENHPEIWAPYTAHFEGLDGPALVAQEEAYSETVSATINVFISMKPGDLRPYWPSHWTLEPTGHEETFGSNASDPQYTPTDVEFHELIVPLLFGPDWDIPVGPPRP
jgi:RHS repeat-associated protein